MEAINFNDFSTKECHEIITAFLIKMNQANSMHSAHRFFHYYLERFYKMPQQLIDDICYCQRAMKNYLAAHQTITGVFAKQPDADPVTKNIYLLEIEQVLYEINAECQYLLICLQDDIDRFCLPFTEQQLQPNVNLINEIVSKAIVPPICSADLLPTCKPHSVTERPTESQLLRKYFTVGPVAKSPLNNPAENAKPTKATTKKEELPAKRIAGPTPESPSKTDVVNVSRLHLQAVLERTRLNKNVKEDSSKESFLQSFGLCTEIEHKRMLLSQALRQKRRPKLSQ